MSDSERPLAGYEYLDHPADIQIHAWGEDLDEAFEWAAVALGDYMTELDAVSVDPDCGQVITAEGHDLKSLLYNFLEEVLVQFHTNLLITKECQVLVLDRDYVTLRAELRGCRFDPTVHPQGTEIKAITYSAIRITTQNPDDTGEAELWVIVDI